MGKITLFCFPYAGGSASIYYGWKKYINKDIEIIPVELAGRGKRFDCQAYDKIDDVVDDAFEIVKKSINGPYGLFGHSMGSIIAFELAHRINDYNLSNPQYLFVSGRKPPHLVKNEKIIHLLPDNEFINKIMDMGGTSKEVFENKELLEIYLPMIRKDFKMVESYKYIEKPPLDVEMIVFYGDEEKIQDSEAKQWSIYTNKGYRLFRFNGNHFFINGITNEVVNVINNVLSNSYRQNLFVG